jgi:hypothetical protein
VRKAATEIGQVLFIGDEDTTFSRRDILRDLKTERATSAKGAGAASFVLASPSVCRVFNYRQVM